MYTPPTLRHVVWASVAAGPVHPVLSFLQGRQLSLRRLAGTPVTHTDITPRPSLLSVSPVTIGVLL